MFLIRSLILSREVLLISGDTENGAIPVAWYSVSCMHGFWLVACKKFCRQIVLRQIPSFSVIYISFLN